MIKQRSLYLKKRLKGKHKIPHKNFNNHKKVARLDQAGIVSKYNNIKYIASIDEVGWGSISGPCVIACVVLPTESEIDVKDSKKYSSEKARSRAADLVIQEALWYRVVSIPVEDINRKGLGPAKNQATIKLLEDALSTYDYKETLVILDGSFIPRLPPSLKNYTILAVPKADEKIKACSAASVIAKVYRDNFMVKLGDFPEYKVYDFGKNKGYLTAEHMAALKQHGVSAQHRHNVGPIKELLKKNASTV